MIPKPRGFKNKYILGVITNGNADIKTLKIDQ